MYFYDCATLAVCSLPPWHPPLLQLVMKLTTLSSRSEGQGGAAVSSAGWRCVLSCDKRSPLPALKCHLRVTAVKCLLRVKCPRNIISLPRSPSLSLSLSHSTLFSSRSLGFSFWRFEYLGVFPLDGSHNCRQHPAPFCYYHLGKHMERERGKERGRERGAHAKVHCPQVAL